MTIPRILCACLLFFVVLSALVTGCATATAPRPDFELTLQRHLDAIQSRNLPAFIKTLTKDKNLKVIFPNGQVLESTQSVIEFHRDWFADDKWVFEPEVIKIIEHSDSATALLRYDYRDTPSGPPRSSWLVLVFALEDDAWRLVHDQNTRID